MAEASIGQPIRLAYLEARPFLDGEFYTRKLMQFGFSRQSASADINEYLKKYGQIMNYCSSRKRFILDHRHKPKILKPEQLAAFAMHVESVYLLAYKPQAKSV